MIDLVNTITCGNCLELLSNLKEGFVDLTITSPPYNLGKTHHTGKKRFTAYNDFNDCMPENEYQENQIAVLNEIYRCTKQGGSLMYNHKNRIKDGAQISPYEWLFKTKWTIKQELVWFNGTPNFDNCRFYPATERIFWLSKGVETDFENNIKQNDLIKDLPEGTNKEHKRAFPVKLAQRFLMCFPNAKIVLDPYMGSGSTALACIKEKRDFIGFDISKNSCKLAEKRIAQELSKITLF